MNKNIFYNNALSDKKTFVIADTTTLAKKGAFLKPFPKFIAIDDMEQIVYEPGDRTDYILQSCLSSNVALILITNN